jgi:hypothetical protein
MRFTRKVFATSVIAAACAVPGALLLSATAAADPVPAPAPAMPNIPFLNSINPAMAPQLLQGLASAFTGGAATPAAAPAAAPAPAATASVTLPQAPAAAAAPAASPLAAALPAAAAPAAAPAAASPAAGLIPTAEVQLPQVPGSPLPMPQQVNFPGDLASLMPAGTPLANLLPKSPTAVPAAAATAAAPALAAPAAAAPAAAAPMAAAPALSEATAPLWFPVAGLP